MSSVVKNLPKSYPLPLGGAYIWHIDARARLTVRDTAGVFGGTGAIVQTSGAPNLVTTNVDWIPAIPGRTHQIYVRKDLRYGEDDITLWPQQYSTTYCHLGCIRTRQGTPPEWAILWWDPADEDFVKGSATSTLTEPLGKLHRARISALADVAEDIVRDFKEYTKSIPEHKIPNALPRMVLSVTLALQRLEFLPTVKDSVFLAARNLQRTLLELDAFIVYMTIYKPRMEKPGGEAVALGGQYVGTYTSDAVIAQLWHSAGLPCWFMRTTNPEEERNVTKWVTPRSPGSQLELSPHPKYPARVIVGNATDAKLIALCDITVAQDLYKDPFDTPATLASQSASSSSQGARPAGRDSGGDHRRRCDGGRYPQCMCHIHSSRMQLTLPSAFASASSSTGSSRGVNNGGNDHRRHDGGPHRYSPCTSLSNLPDYS
jgi:hypothetical protein